MNKAIRLMFLLTAAFSAAPGLGWCASFTTSAIADAFVANGPTGNLSQNNYGGGGALAVGAGALANGEFQSVIKFDLSGVRTSLDAQYGAGQWSIESVSLQLSSSPHSNAIYNDIAPGLFSISLMQNNSWAEGTGNASNPAKNGITYSTLQSTFVNTISDQTLGTFDFQGGASGVNSYTLGLSPQLNSDILTGSDVSLRLFAADNTVSYLFTSRAAESSSQPQLVVAAVPEPGCMLLFGLGLGVLLSRRCGLTW